ncbi:cation-translocating P-type ATPase [[Ruminococcus] gnavus]|nr:cation-translocating P-type ATPase [Mediterraneibacter gnavus]NSI20086.1 cation-translocating P-type ATPase [Mediterraneibacter gnavus]PQL33566.1 cation-translocating P-type ATPase [Mediterraneibacter gnavus ATCC 29149]QEI33779.1 cation-translocating P-type ATPase [Mediterraneibacter gnavus ATCC 29149]QHB25191.1 cation-translocating P-type ATPase [Mediterraneibacter gnavus ATCC 29149]RHD03489.1 cation-translocating P-type ATPase [Mediterraneibacter gnavus]
MEITLEKRIPTTRYRPDHQTGLTAQQVQEHRMHGWTNQPVDPPSKTTKEIIQENVFTYFNLIFLVLAVLLCLVGSFRDLTFLPVIVLNTLIGIIQETRAKKVLDNLTMLNAPHAMVIRDGKKSQINAEDLVVDDIVIFEAGNQVCADAEVCAGEVQVNESLLTGESDEITKRKGDQLMSGSFIVSGQCHARLDKVGADSYISRLTLEAKAMQNTEQSEMIRSLDKLVKWVGVAIIPIGIILFIQAFVFQGEGFRSSVTSMIAAVIGMIPEGLYLLASVALAVSSIRLAQKKVLLHDMKCIETLARVNVLCVDKTGTITENTMEVQDVIPTKEYEEGELRPLSELLGDFTAAQSSDNITMEAMKRYFKIASGKKAVAKTGFSSASKYSSVTFEEASYVLGAPEFVLKEQYENYEEAISAHASKGARVLVFGTAKEEPDGKPLKEAVTPLAYVLLANPIRQEAKETFTYFAEQGVEVKVISGDNPLTVSEVAKEAGIAGAERYVDASTLHTEEEMRAAVLNNAVFGRVTPNQKRKFVQILKEEGKTVAMTGDGVNDVLALKDADCSIAMASGSDAAAQASQLVLLESDFSCMPEVVLEGRRVVNNIQRSASLFLVKNIFSFLLSLVSFVFMFTYPLEPSQISLISMFTIGVPAFFLALEPNKNIIKGHFLTNVFLKALPAALTDVLAVGALVIFGRTFGVSSADISTAATMLLSIVGFMILYTISAPMNVLRSVILGGCIVGLLFCSIFLNDLFAITGMTTKCVMLFVVFAIATEPVLRYLTWLIGKLRFYYKRLRGQKEV